ncbi:ethanolamine permease [Pseudomonas sp. DTU_2021_1001937_2_SI_NGA_ILE_001]|uniref:ethanolamine permease n=1 Tax=Pseudomonas sp. DTU_2021_1001937_2_SI_NGA_ILE_001 TaxID=3077589 RepID=UPI0025F76926|nr:ethanolamine permease [Pseudomonas sp. DTU_2021_1001937_2_SI_NGA_ILE_001]WNW12281.1 ethanolamine permease [Pseudomonas sp. DTU_2021_1001937_2_SI_NGA_ILE_001]
MSKETLATPPSQGGVETEAVSADYFASRQLKQGAAGWVLLIGLGVAYVISGDYAGWNFGLAQGGWGGMFIATLLMATMYLCMCFSLAELSSMIPTAGGGYGFTRTAFGPWGGFLTGTAILIEYAIAPAAIACFIGAYCESLFGIGGWVIYLVFYVVFIGIHILGAGEALKLMFAITAVAAIALAVYILSMAPHFQVSNLFDIPATEAKGASSFLPFGYMGIWAALPYAIWFFLAVEGVPLAAEETKNPQRDLPRGLIGAMLVLLAFAGLILLVGPGAAGAQALVASGNPLVESLVKVYGGSTWMSQFVNLVGLAGLIASFFSIIYAYSRQIFALSRAGYLPRGLSLTNRNKAPVMALVVPGIIGFGLSLTGQGDLLILVAVFGATLSYVMMMAAHITLRVRRPDMPRPYKTPGGVLTSSVALVLAAVALVAGFLVDPRVVIGAAVIYALLIAYFALYSRHHLVSGTPEEEFAAIQAAEQSLR